MDRVNKTEKTYGFLWNKNISISSPNKWHFNNMQDVIDVPIVRGSQGIDIGSGGGHDTYIMAKNNPQVKIISMDISEGVHKTKELTANLDNVNIIKCSALDIPLEDNIFDFAYSFGVLHHTIDPKKGLLEIARILKMNSPVFLYLYEDHSENRFKSIAIKIVTKIRIITIKFPPKTLYFLSRLFSPLIFIFFTLPSIFLNKFNSTRYLSKNIPFNFGRNPFSLWGDLYDRFSTPIEHRFNRPQIYDLFAECGFQNIKITKLVNTAGWVAWGYKSTC